MLHLIKKYRILLLIIIIPWIFIVLICSIKTNDEIIMVGDIDNISETLKVENAYQSEGTLNLVYVSSFEHSSLLQSFVGKRLSDNDVSEISKQYNKFSQAEQTKMGYIQHDQSIESSIIQSYKIAKKKKDSITLDYDFLGAIVRFYFDGTTKFKIGDLITKINDVSAYNNEEEFITSIKEIKVNDVLTVKRGDDIITFSYESSDIISLYRKYQIKAATPTLKIINNNHQGPSAGAMQTLHLLNQLLPYDYTKGLKIAGTGTIEADGKVGAIGGIKQKVIAAYNNHVDVFFCPNDNYEECLKQYNKFKNKERMKLVKVSFFEEMVGYLE